jgi:hypothetical protein
VLAAFDLGQLEDARLSCFASSLVAHKELVGFRLGSVLIAALLKDKVRVCKWISVRRAVADLQAQQAGGIAHIDAEHCGPCVCFPTGQFHRSIVC